MGKGLSTPFPGWGGDTNINFLTRMHFPKSKLVCLQGKQGGEWLAEIPHASPYYPGKQSPVKCLERPSFQRRSLSLKCR